MLGRFESSEVIARDPKPIKIIIKSTLQAVSRMWCASTSCSRCKIISGFFRCLSCIPHSAGYNVKRKSEWNVLDVYI